MPRPFAIALILVTVAFIAAGNLWRAQRAATESPAPEALLALLPNADGIDDENGEPPCFPARSGKMEIGAGLRSDHLDPVGVGYGGELSFLIGLDREGRITGVAPWRHSETPAYFSSLVEEGYFNRFVGRNLAETFDDLDAVSGATITSDAAKAEILAAARQLAATRYQLPLPPVETIPRWRTTPESLAATTVVLILALLAYHIKRRWLRWVSWLTSLAVLGVWLNQSASLPQIAALARLETPGGALEAWVILSAAALMAVARRPAYCAQACPFGALQEIAYRLTPAKLKPSPHWIKRLRPMRWLILAAALAAAAGAGYAPAASFEPFGSLFSRTTPATLVAFALFILVSSAFFRRLWCRLFCPTGACLDLLSRGVSRVKIDEPAAARHTASHEKRGDAHA